MLWSLQIHFFSEVPPLPPPRAKRRFVEAHGQTPPSPNKPQVPPVKCEIRVTRRARMGKKNQTPNPRAGWVMRGSRITGRRQAAGDLPPEARARPREREGRQERGGPQTRLPPAPRAAFLCGGRRRHARRGGGREPRCRHEAARPERSPPPATAAAAPRGPPSRAQLSGPRGALPARSIAPPPRFPRPGTSLPAPLRAPGRSTVKPTNQRHLLPLPRAATPPHLRLLCHPAGDIGGGRQLAAEASASRQWPREPHDRHLPCPIVV